jgi:hypothetical protein
MKLAHGLAIKPSLIHGKGCFATVPFKKRHKIAEYTGEQITNSRGTSPRTSKDAADL